MFTGIIEGTRAIVGVRDGAGGRRLTVDLAANRHVSGPGAAEPIVPGESIAIDGACLTVADCDGSRAMFDVIAETLRRTTLGWRRVGDRVNVERALRATDRLGGHYVQGHVDGVAELDRRVRSVGEVVLRFRGGPDLLEQMIPKGSVAIDGVSLTLVEVDRAGGRFTVALIPTTLERTTLGFRAEGEPVNVETDLLGKYVRQCLAGMLGSEGAPAGLTIDTLRRAGFMPGEMTNVQGLIPGDE